ncbi:MAG: GlsB/YeaQ/YmgE family stress response membrane protein [Actinobacteria bacterium]|nr:GlsB/YeaQ/YmgE family stress response membrane protein [Actinomycetota bacterium]
MGIIGWIVLGLIAGLIAKVIMPGDDPGGIIITAVIGIVGALLGGFLASALFDINVNEEFFDLATWVAAIVGALILLALYRVFAGGRTTARRR